MEANFKVDSFKSIRNYIHNYLGLTKDEVREIVLDEIKKIVHEEVTKTLNDKERLESIVEKELMRQLKYGQDKYERRSFVINTMDHVYNRIDSIIHEEVCKRLRIELVEPKEEDKDE